MMINLRTKLFQLLRSVLKKNGFALVRWPGEPNCFDREVPVEGNEYLTNDNTHLVQLVKRYKEMDADVTNSHVWNWNQAPVSNGLLRSFRGDTAYVWQLKGVDIPELRYLTTTYYQLANDPLRLMNKFNDDSLFGNHLFRVGNRNVSRELLDSANEINFLEAHLKLSAMQNLKILDIGAGYGRLAHRFSEAFSNLEMYYCTDGVPVSAFICDYYLRFRQVKNAGVVPMPDLHQKLKNEHIQLAVNVHSFSECALPAIRWWLSLLSTLKVKYLMIIPNAVEDGGAKLSTNKREDFSALVKEFKYRLIAKSPKYNDPLMQKLGLYPTFYHLFEREENGETGRRDI